MEEDLDGVPSEPRLLIASHAYLLLTNYRAFKQFNLHASQILIVDDDVLPMTTPIAPPTSSLVQSKWELVDYGRGSSSSEEEESHSK